MKSNRFLVILSAMSLVMLLAIVAIIFWPDKPSTLSELKPLISDKSTPTYVEYSYPDGTQYRIEEDSSANIGVAYILTKMDTSFDPNWTNQDQLSRLYIFPTTLSPMKTITDVTDYEQYGLNHPIAYIDVAYSSGNLVRFIVGGKSINGDLQYLRIEGKDEVYAINSSSIAFVYLGDRSLISNTFLTTDYSKIESVSFLRRSDNFSVSFDAIHSNASNGFLQESWQMISPISFAPGSLSMNLLQFLIVFSVESYLPADTDFSSIGLLSPEYTITIFDSEGVIRTIYLSKRTEGGYYGRTDDFKYPFTISSSSLANLDSEPVNFFSLYLFQLKPSDISVLEFYSDNFEYRMDIDILDSETLDSERASVFLNYISLKTLAEDGRYKFNVIYDVMKSIRVSGYEPTSMPNPEINTYMTITLRDRTQVKYSFSFKNNREMYLFINDIYSGIVINSGTLLSSDTDYEPENSLEGAMNYVLSHLDA